MTRHGSSGHAPHPPLIMSFSLSAQSSSSDAHRFVATIGIRPVMASSSIQNVVKNSQSVVESSPTDVHAIQSTSAFASNAAATSPDTHITSHLSHSDKASSNLDPEPSELVVGESGVQAAPARNGTLEHAFAPLTNGAESEGDVVRTGSQEIGGGAHDATSGTKERDYSAEDNTSADISVGSDSDSKADSTEQGRDGQPVSRSVSMRKPASFKPVSITKTFLAKSVPTPLVAKLGDKSTLSRSRSSLLLPLTKFLLQV